MANTENGLLYQLYDRVPIEEDFMNMQGLFDRLVKAPRATVHTEDDREIVEVWARRDETYPDIMRKVRAERFNDTGGRTALAFSVESSHQSPMYTMRIHEVFNIAKHHCIDATKHVFTTVDQIQPDDLLLVPHTMPPQEADFMEVKGYDCWQWLTKLVLITNAP